MQLKYQIRFLDLALLISPLTTGLSPQTCPFSHSIYPVFFTFPPHFSSTGSIEITVRTLTRSFLSRRSPHIRESLSHKIACILPSTFRLCSHSTSTLSTTTSPNL